MNKTVSQYQVSDFVIKIKTVQSNKYLITKYASSFSFDPKCEVVFEFEEDEIKKLNPGQYYKIQLAYVSKYHDDVDGYDKELIGYYSTVGVIKYTVKPNIYISGLEQGQVNMHNYQYSGVYSQKFDVNEKAYSYCFNLYDGDGKLLQTSGEQIHNSQHDVELYESIDIYNIEQDLDINKAYYIEYLVTTVNKMVISSGKYKIMQKKSINPEIKADLVPTLNYENGYINLQLQGHINNDGVEYAATGAFKIVRASDEDNFATWNEVLKFALYGQQPSRWMWQDMTVKQGVTYRYALQQYNDSGLTSNRLESTKIYADFEHAFLYDGERQLKIKYNPKVSSFKNTVLESKTDTIGNQYPFIFRNGNVKYKEFPISGLISCKMDEDFLFIDKDDIIDYDWTSNLISENIASEREFKLEVLDWLNNGKPKLFRSPTEGNYIVRLLNVSMSPNDTLGRMIHTFTATAYEIDEYSYANLIKHNLISVGDPTVAQLRWETIQLDKTGIGSASNILHYKAVSLHFEGMIPGDKLYINDGIERTYNIIENGRPIGMASMIGYEVTIGVTGSYIIDLKEGVTINSVSFRGSNDNQNVDNQLVQHQGSLTYAYYSKVQNRFDSISDITISDVAMQQFIGQKDILDEIEDIRCQIQSIYWIRAMLRETASGYYAADGGYYIDKACTTPIEWDAYVLYHITDLTSIDKKTYWYDWYNNQQYSEYNTNVYFSVDAKESMDLSDTHEWYVKNPKDIETLICGNGVMIEISYQLQTLSYRVETNGVYPELTRLKKEMDVAYQQLQWYLCPYTEETEDEFPKWAAGFKEEEQEIMVQQARQTYEKAYLDFIVELERTLELEEEAQGDAVA